MQNLMPLWSGRPCHFKNVLRPCFILGLLVCSGLANGLQFEFVNRGDIPLSTEEMGAVKRAAALWSEHFSDPITVKINLEWKEKSFFISDEILASVQIARTTAPIAMLRDSLLAEADASEASLLSHIPLAVPVAHSGVLMQNASVTLANAKALGITPANDPQFGEALVNRADAHISFNLVHRHEYFYHQDQVEGDKYDFTGITSHEIGHALGFTSIVDIQDMNPGVLLNPMLLDVFRFPGGIGNPSTHVTPRQTLPGYAQFFDDMAPFSVFGSGFNIYDPASCALPNKRCSASHWDDHSGNLMTSVEKAKTIVIAPDDVHAIDRIGVDTKWRSGIPLVNVKAEFYSLSQALPQYDPQKFSTKTHAPSFSSITPNFSAAPTHAFHISIDGHAASGYAMFVPEATNYHKSAIDFQPRDAQYNFVSQWEAESQVEDMKNIPAHFSHFYFQSKNAAYRFNFISTFSNYGAIFDPHLGEFGGFRLSGFLDAELDGDFFEPSDKNRDEIQNDYDATITFLLLFQKPHTIANGISGVPLSIEWQDKRIVEDNILHLIDNSAFGAPSSYNNTSSYQDAWKFRVKQLEGDIVPGRDIAL